MLELHACVCIGVQQRAIAFLSLAETTIGSWE
jgi:hypothetical protein